MTNAVRHSGAARIVAELHSTAAAAELEVRDDGSGFDLAAVPHKVVHGGGFAPAVVFGPKGRGLHCPDEFVELDSIVTCAQALTVAACTYARASA